MSRARTWLGRALVLPALVAALLFGHGQRPEAPTAAAALASLLPIGSAVDEVRLAEGGFARAPRIEIENGTIVASDGAVQRRLEGLHPAGEVVRRTVWFGTDHQGRDLAARFFAGLERSISVGLLAALLALAIGAAWGIAAAPTGVGSRALAWSIEVGVAFPRLLLLLAAGLWLGSDLGGCALAVALVSAVDVALPSRALGREFFAGELAAAGHAIGIGPGSLWWRHLIPLQSPLILSLLPILIGRAMLLEATLGFLGVGADPSHESWGRLIADGRRFLPQAWPMVVIPGLALLLFATWAQRRAARVGAT